MMNCHSLFILKKKNEMCQYFFDLMNRVIKVSKNMNVSFIFSLKVMKCMIKYARK